MSESNSEAVRADVQFFESEISPVVQEFQDKYGDDVPRLIDLLSEHDTMDAMLAMKRLGELNAVDAVEPLLRIVVAPPRVTVTAVAIIVLGQLGDKRAVKPLIDVVDGAEKRAAMETDNIGPPSGWRGWFIKLSRDTWWDDIRASSNQSVRVVYLRNGISALGILGDKRAIESIRKRLNDSDELVQAAAVEALRRLEAV